MRSFRCALLRPSCLSRRQPSTQWLQPRHGRTRTLASAASMHFGQPLHETHPHLLGPGELTPGITAFEYAERRARLAASLPPNSIAILAAADTKYRSGLVFYKFHQDPNFLYLTGFNEPEAVAVIEKHGNGAEHTFHLYCRPKDSKMEKWDGSRSGIQAALDVFNADECGDINNIIPILSSIINGGRTIFTDIPTEQNSKSTFTKIIFGATAPDAENIGDLLQKAKVRPLRPFVHEQRVTKSNAEIACMRKAGKVSGQAFTEAMGQQFGSEKELETYLEYKFKSLGCEESAYVPVVAGGENALQIHYVQNDKLLRKEDLVTVDAGGEYGGYVADITRAWPVGGKFTPAQRDLYQMILGVQEECVALCRENAKMSLDGLHSVAEAGLRDGLRSLGFDMSNNALEQLFPHHLGHYVGLGVHDAPGHSRTAWLRKNQAITIEPGVYVEDNERWPEHFRGIGIRIEDTVCIGSTESYVLTSEAVKQVVDIESTRGWVERYLPSAADLIPPLNH